MQKMGREKLKRKYESKKRKNGIRNSNISKTEKFQIKVFI